MLSVIFTKCYQLFSQTTLSSFQKPDFSVPRQHEDFIWLHDTLVETEDYAGLIVRRTIYRDGSHPETEAVDFTVQLNF